MVRPRGHTVHYVPSSSLLLNKPVEFESVLAAQNSKASKGLPTLLIAGPGQMANAIGPSFSIWQF